MKKALELGQKWALGLGLKRRIDILAARVSPMGITSWLPYRWLVCNANAPSCVNGKPMKRKSSKASVRVAGAEESHAVKAATQSQPSFLDSPEDPYFFPGDTEDELAPAQPSPRLGCRDHGAPADKKDDLKQGVLTQSKERGTRLRKPSFVSEATKRSRKLGQSKQAERPSGEAGVSIGERYEALDEVGDDRLPEARLQGDTPRLVTACTGETPPQTREGCSAEAQCSKEVPGARLPGQSRPQQPSRLARTTTADDPEAERSPEAQHAHGLGCARPQGGHSRAELRTSLLMRNALGAGLGRILSGSIFNTPAPAVTIVEAQETGEQVTIQDTVLYALDGLCSTSVATHRQSSASLADVCSTRRGRRAIRAEGVLEEAVTAAKQLLSVSWDPEVALAFSVIMLMYARDATNLAVLASKDCLLLLRLLLEGNSCTGADTCTSHRAMPEDLRLSALLREDSQLKAIPRWVSTSPTAVALLALIGATDPQRPAQAAEAVKSGIREFDVLSCLAKIACSVERNDDRSLWLVHTALVGLENCSFACHASEAALIDLKLQDQPSPRGFIAGLVHMSKLLQEIALERPEKGVTVRECIQCTFSVLMNLTNHNGPGCTQVLQAGGMEDAARLLASILNCTQKQQLLSELGMLSVTIGLLVNLAENQPQEASRIEEIQLPGGSRLLSALCRLIEDFAPAEDAVIDGAAGAELTSEDLAAHEEEGRAAILQMYAALLVGFLVAPRPALRAEACAALSCCTLAPVTAGVQRCLQFYSSTGAISNETDSSLRSLLATLQSGEG